MTMTQQHFSGPPCMLIIDETSTLADTVIEHLHRTDIFNFDHRIVTSSAQFELLLQQRVWDLILCHYAHTPLDPTDLLQLVQRIQPQTPVIVMGSQVTPQEAFELGRLGVQEFIETTDTQHGLDRVQQTLFARQTASAELSAAQQLELILDSMQDAIMTVSLPDHHLIFVSSSYAQVFGYPANVFLKDRDFYKQVMPSDDVDMGNTALQAVYRDGFVELDHRVIWPNGEVHWLHRRAWINFDSQGKPIQLIDTARDITESKAAESKLHRFKSIISSTSDGIAVLNREYCYEMVNAAYLERTTRSQQEIVGHPIAEIMGEALFQELLKPQIDRSLAGATSRVAYWFEYPSSGKRYLSTTYSPYRDTSNEIIGVVAITWDITDQKQVEDDLRAHEQQLKSLIDSQTNYMIRTDLEGRYTYWNPKFEREFGWLYEPQGIRGGLSLDLTLAYHHQRTQEAVEKCLANPGMPVQVELDKHARHGGIRNTLWEFICLTDENGLPTGIQCTGIDITLQKEAQATVQFQTRMLQQVSDAIITFDNDRKITTWNKAAVETFGWTEVEALGQQREALLKTKWLTDSRQQALEAYDQTGHWSGELLETDKFGGQHHIVASVNRLYGEQGQALGGVILNRDVTSERRRSALEGRISQILEATAEGQKLPAILEKLVVAIEEYEPDIKASILLLDAKTQQLRHGAAPSLPDAYNAAIDGITIGSGVGSCGTAAFEKRLVIVEDIATDPLWKDFKLLAAEYGLKACWSHPVMDRNGEILATFAMYYGTTRYPTEKELDLIQLAAHITGLAIEHARGQIALRASEEKYRCLLESSDSVIAEFDYSGQVLYANEVAARRFGLTPQQLVGKAYFDLFPPEVAKTQLTNIRTVIDTGSGIVREAITIIQDEKRWYRTSIQPVRDSLGNTLSAMVNSTDITAIKQAEATLQETNRLLEQRIRERTAELQEERNLLRTVIDAIPDFIYVKDRQHRLILNNAAYVQAIGAKSGEEIIGKTDLDLLPTQFAVQFHADEERLFETEQAINNLEEHVFGPDGSEAWMLTSKAPLRNIQGEIIGLVGTTRNISAIKAAGEALRTSEERYRATIASMSEGLIVHDKDGAIQMCNSAAARILGLTVDQMLGRTSLDPRWRAIHEDGSPFPGETHPAMVTLKTGKPQANVIMGVHKPDDTQVWILINSQSLIDPVDQKLYAVVVTFADITVPKQAEVAIQAALTHEKELGELKSRFVSMASHEFRNPLAAILAMTETLTLYWEHMDKTKIDDRLKRVREQATRMTAIMEDVLQMTRIQTGHTKFEPTSDDLDALCTQVISDLAELPDYRDRICYECLHRPVKAIFDARLLQQAITNLLHNALKYSPSEKSVHITLEQENGHIVLRIMDEGIGIPPEDLKHLFEPFHRAANVGQIYGTGLGLGIAKEAVELHRGTITVESQVNVGTTFTVTLPDHP
ncbi:MAG: PAS domain S-box protein [Anaerolineae bacterium]